MRPLPTGLRRLATALLLSAVLTLVAWRTGGEFFKVDGRYYGWNLDVTRVLLFVALTALFYVLPRVLKRSQRIPRWVFAGWVVYLGIWLVAVWPGIVMTDTQSLTATSQLGVVREWFPWMHSVFMIAALDLIPHVWLITVIQVLATAATMAYATQVLMAWRPNAGAAIAMNVVAALSIPVVVNAVLLSRDIFFALLHVVLALAVAETVTSRKAPTSGRIAAIAALTGFLSLYRGDGIVLLVVVPVLLMALRPLGRPPCKERQRLLSRRWPSTCSSRRCCMWRTSRAPISCRFASTLWEPCCEATSTRRRRIETSSS